jgi:hypothetical protein
MFTSALQLEIDYCTKIQADSAKENSSSLKMKELYERDNCKFRLKISFEKAYVKNWHFSYLNLAKIRKI